MWSRGVEVFPFHHQRPSKRIMIIHLHHSPHHPLFCTVDLWCPAALTASPSSGTSDSSVKPDYWTKTSVVTPSCYSPHLELHLPTTDVCFFKPQTDSLNLFEPSHIWCDSTGKCVCLDCTANIRMPACIIRMLRDVCKQDDDYNLFNCPPKCPHKSSDHLPMSKHWQTALRFKCRNNSSSTTRAAPYGKCPFNLNKSTWAVIMLQPTSGRVFYTLWGFLCEKS